MVNSAKFAKPAAAKGKVFYSYLCQHACLSGGMSLSFSSSWLYLVSVSNLRQHCIFGAGFDEKSASCRENTNHTRAICQNPRRPQRDPRSMKLTHADHMKYMLRALSWGTFKLTEIMARRVRARRRCQKGNLLPSRDN